MSFVERFRDDPWFALANISIFGSIGYLALNKILRKSGHCSSHKGVFNKSKSGKHGSDKKQPIHKIVLSGGPCAGKTTAADEIKRVFEKKGFKVMIVPEAAKILVESGAMILMDRLTADERIQFQTLIVKQVLHFEDYFVRLAEMSGLPSIVVCDRGTLDVQAYMGKQQFECMLDNNGWTLNYLGEKRYDQVIYMVTCAEGAESFYSLENNVARHETADEARSLDARTLKAWESHSKLSIFRNVEGQTFEDKISHVIEKIHLIVGLKHTTKKVQKYLVKQADFPVEQQVFTSEITETFLIDENPQQIVSDRIQKVDDKGIYNYFRIITRNVGTVTNFIPNQIKKSLTPIEYMYFLSNQKDPKLDSVNIIKSYFVYQKQFFTLNTILLKTGTIRVLKATIIGKSKDLEAPIPNYFVIEKDVSKDPNYRLIEYAKIQAKN